MVDIRMPGIDGVEVTRTVTRRGSGAPRMLVLTTDEIADHLVVGRTTVETHVSRMLAQVAVGDRVQAVAFAMSTAWCSPAQRRPGPGCRPGGLRYPARPCPRTLPTAWWRAAPRDASATATGVAARSWPWPPRPGRWPRSGSWWR